MKYVNAVRGYNSRLDPIQAAILKVKLKHLDGWNAHRAKIAGFYSRELAHTGLILPHVPQWADPVWHVYVVRHPRRDEFRSKLERAGIETLIHYPIAPHEQDAYKDHNWSPESFPLAKGLAGEVLSIPMGTHVTEEGAAAVVEAIRALSEVSTASQGSHGQILRSSSIIGASSIGGVVLGLGRTKVVAVLLGPGGVGLIGIYSNLITTVSGVAALGFGTAGVRSIADANANHDLKCAGGSLGGHCPLARSFWHAPAAQLSGSRAADRARHPGRREICRRCKLAGDRRFPDRARWRADGEAEWVQTHRRHRVCECPVVLCATGIGVGAVVAFGRRGLLALFSLCP